VPDHYYSSKPTSSHEFNQIEVKLRGVQLKLATDAGVFSKDRIDNGTKLLINTMPLPAELKTVLDLGCGYGPIGLTIAKLLPEATIYMTDINERAVELAVQNARLNGIVNVILKSGEGFQPVSGINFDMIVTNPPIRAGKQIVYPLVDAAFQVLNPGGYLVTVIMTKQGAKSLEQKMAGVFGNVAEWEKGSGYRVLVSRK
jgi:16S rRNA (guanine1207-N2)-methyltransferase